MQLKTQVLVLIFICSGLSKAFSNSLDYELSNEKLDFKAGLYHLGYYNEEQLSSSYVSFSSKIQTTFFKFEGFGFAPLNTEEGLLTYSVPELFYNQNIKGLKVTLGRKIHEWTSYEELKPAGFWNNSWDFNKSDPRLEGLFGLFLEFKRSKKSKFTFFVSPVGVPKLVQHQDFKSNGQYLRKTPWVGTPPETINYASQNLRVNYDLLDIDYVGLISNFQIGGSYDFKSEHLFFKTSYLSGNSKIFDMSLDFSIDASLPETPVNVDISIKTQRVHRFGFDLGYEWGKGSKTVLSLNHFHREGSLIHNDQSHIGLGSGDLIQIFHEESFFNGRLKTVAFLNENTSIQNNSTGELDELLKEHLQTPFRFRRGAGVKFDYNLNKHILSGLFYYDHKLKGAHGRFDLTSKVRQNMYAKVGVGFVEALNSKSTDFYKEFRKSDHFYGGLSVVF